MYYEKNKIKISLRHKYCKSPCPRSGKNEKKTYNLPIRKILQQAIKLTGIALLFKTKKSARENLRMEIGAGERSRTVNLDLGKVAL